jgi:hypothetical protein
MVSCAPGHRSRTPSERYRVEPPPSITGGGHGGTARTRDVAVRFAGGQSARLEDSAALKSGLGPVVTRGSRAWVGRMPAADEDSDVAHWSWSLPPAGAMTVSLSRSEIGLDEADIIIDGDEARRIADTLPRAEDRKPPSGDRSTDPTTTPARADNDVALPHVVGMESRTARAPTQGCGLFLEHLEADGPPLASGAMIRRQPASGALVHRFAPIKARVRDARDGPGDFTQTDDPDGGYGPPGDVREPRRPRPGSGEDRIGEGRTHELVGVGPTRSGSHSFSCRVPFAVNGWVGKPHGMRSPASDPVPKYAVSLWRRYRRPDG